MTRVPRVLSLSLIGIFACGDDRDLFSSRDDRRERGGNTGSTATQDTRTGAGGRAGSDDALGASGRERGEMPEAPANAQERSGAGSAAEPSDQSRGETDSGTSAGEDAGGAETGVVDAGTSAGEQPNPPDPPSNEGTEPPPGDGADEGVANEAADAGGSTSSERRLPDLVVDGDYLRSTVQQDFVDASADMCLFNEGCVTGDGMRRVIRFGTRTGNVGSAELVAGRPALDNPIWEYDACHEHFHFEGYAHYDLVAATSGETLPIGVKNGFCLRDQGPWSSEFAGNDCGKFDCEQQGMGIGCSDVYESDLDCQWVDITGVPAGVYEIVVTVNSEQTIEELDRSNNVARVSVEITPDTVRVMP